METRWNGPRLRMRLCNYRDVRPLEPGARGVGGNSVCRLEKRGGGISLTIADLRHASLVGATIPWLDLHRSPVAGAEFSKANLIRADMRETDGRERSETTGGLVRRVGAGQLIGSLRVDWQRAPTGQGWLQAQYVSAISCTALGYGPWVGNAAGWQKHVGVWDPSWESAPSRFC